MDSTPREPVALFTVQVSILPYNAAFSTPPTLKSMQAPRRVPGPLAGLRQGASSPEHSRVQWGITARRPGRWPGSATGSPGLQGALKTSPPLELWGSRGPRYRFSYSPLPVGGYSFNVRLRFNFYAGIYVALPQQILCTSDT